MKISLSKSKQFQIVGEVCDGFDAIDYLLGKECFIDRNKYPLPKLIILDLKMPRMNGFEVLEWIREQHSRELPVVMVSGSWLQTDIDRSLALGATAYFSKTSTKEEQISMIKSMEDLLRMAST